MTLAMLDGKLLPLADARVSVLDRGFMFGDGVYEVVRVLAGRPFLVDEHLARTRGGLAALAIDGVDLPSLRRDALALLAAAPMDEATLYWQVTRGAPPTRTHAPFVDEDPFEDAPPRRISPTVFVYAMPFVDRNSRLRSDGARAITHDDLRWGRCDIKSINLLGNVFAATAARGAGVYEAILVRGGVVTEGSHTTVFAVVDGELRTHPLGPRILPGVTRAIVVEDARAIVPVNETAIDAAGLARASEVILAGTTTEVMPVVAIDGVPVGDGRVGPVATALAARYAARLASFRAGATTNASP